MSDNYTIETDETDETLDVADAETPKGLRRAASKSKQLEAELQAAKRELAFIKAGIPVEDPRMGYFMRGYDGEITAEAIRQAAIDAGFVQVQQKSQDPNVVAAAAAQQRVTNASVGAFVDDSSEDAALARLEQAMNEGGMDAMMDVARQFGIPIGYEQ